MFRSRPRYVFSWAKLRLALYIIWVFSAPSLAMSRISAIMNRRSRLLRVLSQFINLYTLSRSFVYSVDDGGVLKGVFRMILYSVV